MKYFLWILGAGAVIILAFLIINNPKSVYNPSPKSPTPTAVSEPSPQETSESMTLEGADWVLTQMSDDGQMQTPAGQITANFEAGILSGSSGCNSYSTGYELGTLGVITIDEQIASTAMACADEDISTQEFLYTSLLPQVIGFEVIEYELNLMDENGQVILQFESANF